MESDYYLPDDFVALGVTLKKIAAAQCAGTITIEKQIGDVITTNAPTEESDGWAFDASQSGADEITPANGVTGVVNERHGQLQFALKGGTNWSVTIAETDVKEGYALKDIECTYGGSNAPFLLQRVGDSATFPMTPDQSVRCIFLNSRDGGLWRSRRPWRMADRATRLRSTSTTHARWGSPHHWPDR